MKSLHHFRISTSLIALASVGGLAFGASPALAIDWSGVPASDITLFYPGQASWEWVLTQADHGGAPKIRAGKSCRTCHDAEEADIGDLIVSGEKLEPAPIAGKRGSIPVKVKAAHDDARLYLQLQWTAQDLPGAPMDAEHAARVTVMFDDGKIAEAARGGCWAMCHDDLTGMASNDGSELQKYLGSSRTGLTRQGGGRNYKPDAELATLLANGDFLEYWQAQLNPGAPAKAVSGYVLKDREVQTPSQVSAEANFAGGVWTVELSRPLQVSGGHYKTFAPGATYVMGIAIHDAHAAKRFHHVSYEHTLVLDSGDGDLIAVKK